MIWQMRNPFALSVLENTLPAGLVRNGFNVYSANYGHMMTVLMAVYHTHVKTAKNDLLFTFH